MSAYVAPLKDMRFVLNELSGLSEVAKLPGFEEASPDTVDAILEEASRFASEVLDPINLSGDQEGSKLSDGEVRTPRGFRDAYRKFCDGGWNALPFSHEWGGQGLPKLVSTPVQEMWKSSNLSFSLCPLLTQGAEGKPGKRNSAKCASIEHKLGIHASPTAVMVYDKALGYLVGEENRGLEYMFIMMNAARFAVGLEGVAIAERSFQRALAF